MPGYEIEWGAPPEVDYPCQAGLDRLKEELARKAKGTNAFTIHLTHGELIWLQNNLDNGIVEVLISHLSGEKPFWVVVGTDPVAIAKKKTRMRK